MSERFSLTPTPLAGVTLVERKPHGDARGAFERMFCTDELGPLFGRRRVVQINRTYTRSPGTVRGLHWQNAPHAEAKLVSCLHGKVYDVVVDLRRESATYLRWHAELLSGDNHRSLFIPEGCAHGFQAMSSDCELLYLHTAAYSPQSEAGLYPLDPRLSIMWPLPVHSLSERDARHPLLTPEFKGVEG